MLNLVKDKPKRAVITPEFLDAVRQISKSRSKALSQLIETSNRHMQAALKQKYGPHIARLYYIAANKSEDGKRLGMDYEVARFRLITGYEKFEVVEHNGVDYLVGVTLPITADMYRKEYNRLTRMDGPSQKTGAQYALGSYVVAFPVLDLERASLERMHLIPRQNFRTYSRHFHHTASDIGLAERYSPLDMKPYTCWGSFGQIATDCAEAGDLPDLYRTMYLFLTRYDSNSPLARPDAMSHAELL